MKKRMSVLISVLFVLTALLSACGGGNASGGNNGKKVINVALWDENVRDTLDKSIKIFNEKHPNVEVKVTYTPWADYWTKLKNSKLIKAMNPMATRVSIIIPIVLDGEN